ncbi:MAG TPA: nucleotidyltransferase family protein [Gaiellaceae bacterium]|nr:nucleotidyltransferase family protein [Gaiellaceae bacterium]
MKALVLAAGYATRLRPLTDTWAKELLPVGGRPIIDWILDAVSDVGAVDEVHVVTNSNKAPVFREWAAARDGDVRVHDDGTSSNDDRLGAIGDLRFVIDSAGIDDDMLVIAGDNLFDFSLGDFATFWDGKRGGAAASAVAVRDVGSLELARRYGIVALDDQARVTEFVEKPEHPPSTLAATATYLFDRRHVARVGEYLDAGNPHDQPGLYVAWLQQVEPVYGWLFVEPWYDIGDAAQLLVADNHLRARRGMPERDTYSPDA